MPQSTTTATTPADYYDLLMTDDDALASFLVGHLSRPKMWRYLSTVEHTETGQFLRAVFVRLMALKSDAEIASGLAYSSALARCRGCPAPLCRQLFGVTPPLEVLAASSSLSSALSPATPSSSQSRQRTHLRLLPVHPACSPDA